MHAASGQVIWDGRVRYPDLLREPGGLRAPYRVDPRVDQAHLYQGRAIDYQYKV